MADHLALTIPMANVAGIQLYINTGKKTLAQIKAETKADYLLNGTLYNMATFAPVCHLRADGKNLCTPAYSVAGYAWDEGADIAMALLPAERANFIACTPLIVDGKAVKPLAYDDGQGGSRGRSAIGLKEGRLALYCSRDGGPMARTPEQLQSDLLSAGWESAVMLDGGASSQCDFAGEMIPSDRRVQNLLLVFLRKEEAEDNEPDGAGEKDEPAAPAEGLEIGVYSKAKQGQTYLTAHFKVREFACKDGSDTIRIARMLPIVCEYLRVRTGKAFTPNSAYRTPAYIAKVGGVSNSQHTLGTAADIPKLSGYTPKAMAQIVREILPTSGGVGIYDWGIHVDVRKEKADW